MPPRESDSLEVTFPVNSSSMDSFPMAFRGALLWGAYLALFFSFPYGVGG